MSARVVPMPNLQARRGGALILSILILVAMTGLGLLAVTAAKMEATVAGNYRTLKQAQYMAEAGLVAASMRMQGDPASFVRLVKSQGEGAVHWRCSDFGPNEVFVDSVDDDQSQQRSMGFDTRGIDFDVWVESMRDLPACPGHSTGTMCCLKVALVSEGRVGDFDDEGIPLEGTDAARRRVRAEYAVPYPCPR